jgi:hypothetical protein
VDEFVLLAAVIFGVAAVVQSFRVYDANDRCQSYKKACDDAEYRWRENIAELRRVEKEHSRMVQMITDFADRLNE